MSSFRSAECKRLTNTYLLCTRAQRVIAVRSTPAATPSTLPCRTRRGPSWPKPHDLASLRTGAGLDDGRALAPRPLLQRRKRTSTSVPSALRRLQQAHSDSNERPVRSRQLPPAQQRPQLTDTTRNERPRPFPALYAGCNRRTATEANVHVRFCAPACVGVCRERQSSGAQHQSRDLQQA
jgi:hypothetical protein